MGKYTLKIEYDYDFVLIGISSHEKDYRFCWALNKALDLELTKGESLEIKAKKLGATSFFSLFQYENTDEFREYFVLSNSSENKQLAATATNLFNKSAESDISGDSGILIPEHRQMDYFLVIRGEIEEEEVDELLLKLKAVDFVLTAVRIDVEELKSKTNLVF